MGKLMWRFLGSVNLSIWLLLAIAINLAVGGRYAKSLPAVYGELNYLRFQDWLTGNGLDASWWVWSLFFLLSLFGMNTAACTADRLAGLLKNRREYSLRALTVAAAPSVMHLCFLVIIGGHAISQFAADIRRVEAKPGAGTSLAASQVTVLDDGCSREKGVAVQGRAGQCGARLFLSSPSGAVTRTVYSLSPVSWQGYTITLAMAGKPAGNKAPPVEIIIKKDPGLPLILFGNALLCLLMLWYFPVMMLRKNREDDRPCH